MPVEDWKRAEFVYERRNKRKGLAIDGGKEMPFTKASVVPVSWLFEQLMKCVANNRETIRIAADKNGDIYIEGFFHSDDLENYTGPSNIDPEGWSNDWPEISVP